MSGVRRVLEMLVEAFPDEQATVETVAAYADTARDYLDLCGVLLARLDFPFPEPNRGATIGECPTSK
jgi:hypothetical protein